MKKMFLCAALAVSYSVSMAQISVGGQLGANLAFGKASTDYVDPYLSTTLTNDPKAGLLVGVVAEIPLGEKFAFRPELNFIQKGSTTGIAASILDELQTKITLNYLELPLNVVYKLNVGSGNFFFGLGPALAFGMGGKVKLSDASDPNNTSVNTSYKVKFDGKKEDDLNRSTDKDFHYKKIDVGVNVLAGYKLQNGLFFKLGYNYGLLNVDPNKDNKLAADQATYKNRGFNVCIGFLIGGAKND
jgi:Outer membrane protein beta-barrel domain